VGDAILGGFAAII